jgi:hypothetical protein
MDNVNGGPGSSEWDVATAVLEALGQLTRVRYPRVGVGPAWPGLLEDIIQFMKLLLDDADVSAGRIAIARMNEKLLAFNSEFSIVNMGRKLFRTSKGLLGLGMRSVKEGDVVWAFENAQMAMVLRPSRTEASNGLMEFVGDAYLHGCMRGEMFQALDVNRKSREVSLI